MATPQQYSAWTRGRRRAAKQELEFLGRHFELDVPVSFPFVAALCDVPTETKPGSIESRVEKSFEKIVEEGKQKGGADQQAKTEQLHVINSWYAKRIHAGVAEHNLVCVYVENPDDPPKEWRKKFKLEGWVPRYRLSTLMHIQSAWTADYLFGFAETEALKKLRGLIEPLEYERYLLTGIIIFVGKGGVQYMIRKGRPTLSFRIVPSITKEGEATFYPLAAMCMHPAGYFARTWTGFLPPTDDVLAHLLILRQGEHEFWKRCNQHHFDAVEAGV